MYTSEPLLYLADKSEFDELFPGNLKVFRRDHNDWSCATHACFGIDVLFPERFCCIFNLQDVDVR